MDEDMVMDLEPARWECMHVMEPRDDNKVNNIMMVETETEPEENEMGEERLLLPAINEHIPKGLQLQEVLED